MTRGGENWNAFKNGTYASLFEAKSISTPTASISEYRNFESQSNDSHPVRKFKWQKCTTTSARR